MLVTVRQADYFATSILPSGEIDAPWLDNWIRAADLEATKDLTGINAREVSEDTLGYPCRTSRVTGTCSLNSHLTLQTLPLPPPPYQSGALQNEQRHRRNDHAEYHIPLKH
jgi:hypothetical protein